MYNVEELFLNNDLVELVERAGGKLHKTGGEMRGACPLHGGHDANAFAVYTKNGKQLWTCFSGDCGTGDLIAFVQVWRNLDFKRACIYLGGDPGDPVEMTRLVAERAEKAKLELDAAIEKAERARAELQAAQIHLYYHEHMPDCARNQWHARGLNDSDIGFFYLGGREDYTVGEWHTPTLTIPIFDSSRNLLNVKHRLINPNPAHPKDKYRPEREGLGAAAPFLAVPEMGYDAETVVVVEGEIKGAVTWARCGSIDTQVIGVPGKSHFPKLADRLFGKSVVIVPDPGAYTEAHALAKSVGGRMLLLADKIDDMVVAQGYDADWLKSMIRQARRIA